jgi:glycosyltransferase involved in cell wall biosynthesis
LRAARELKRRGVPFHWRFAGEEALGSPGYRAYLLGLVGEWGLEEHVELSGWVGDMPGFYRSLDVLVHVPVDPEPYGLVLAEAFSSRLTVVATPGGADPIVEAAGGVLVPPSDPVAVADALAELVERPGELAARQARARQVAEQLFDTRRYAQELAAIYDSVVEHSAVVGSSPILQPLPPQGEKGGRG